MLKALSSSGVARNAQATRGKAVDRLYWHAKAASEPNRKPTSGLQPGALRYQIASSPRKCWPLLYF